MADADRASSDANVIGGPLPQEAHLPRRMPFAYQLAEGITNDCGPYSLAMTLAYWGDEPYNNLQLAAQEHLAQVNDITHLAAQLARHVPFRLSERLPGGKRFGGATPPLALIETARKAGVQFLAEPNAALAGMKRAIVAGRPTIVLVRPAGSTGLVRHYRVLVGYAEGRPTRYYFNDPGYPAPPETRTEPGNWTVEEPLFLDEWEHGGFGPLWRRWRLTIWRDD